MDKLWAPWRIEYIRAPKEKGCVFCTKSEPGDNRDNLVLFRGENSFILMNLYPYSNGHLMIAPYQHTSETTDLSRTTNTEIMKTTMKAEGFNFGANLGKAAGAGIEEHLHYHVVPRWIGDTNFMPVLGHTKVMVEILQETWDILKLHFNKLQESV